ncbi:MAG: glycosyltransferase family 2 protein [Planctomycetia bacterium]|nr:glycosyltransferase family 2 protein [Planctomycetia bacterium]
MTRLTISIALCTYHGEKFLQEQLDSLANQTRLPDEVVVGDDGSTDRTLEILENWAKTVSFPVKITRNEKNLGFAKNFEATMMRCTGDVIFPCDQDDIWLPTKLEKMTAVMENHPKIGAVYCTSTVFYMDGRAPISIIPQVTNWHRYFIAYYTTPFYDQNPMDAGCCSAWRRELLPNFFPIPSGWFHDMWFYVLAPHFTQVYTIMEPLIYYRRHTSNASYSNAPENRGWGDETQKNNFRASVYLYKMYRPQMESLEKRLHSIKSTQKTCRHLQYLQRFHSHFRRRIRTEENLIRNFGSFFREFITGGYFRFRQPIRSILFDLKEGLSRK